MLVASVPLSDEPRLPLARGEFLAVMDGSLQRAVKP